MIEPNDALVTSTDSHILNTDQFVQFIIYKAFLHRYMMWNEPSPKQLDKLPELYASEERRTREIE